MENPLDNTDLKVGLETEPNIRESAGSVVARASSKVHEEVDPIEEPVIYEILPSEFYTLVPAQEIFLLDKINKQKPKTA